MKLNLLLFFLFLSVGTFAQDITEEYFTFSGFISNGKTEKALESALKILPQVDKLSEKRKVLFYSRLAKLYEENKDAENATKYYEKVAVLVPDYYVAHLALGYLYMKPANALAPKINAAKGDRPLYEKYMAEYKAYIKKSLPHLEKAYACDPNDQVMNLLVRFSKTLNLPSDEVSLKTKTASLAKNCITLLTED